MGSKRTPQTFEKRARERAKQLKREAKKAERLARNAAKRDGTVQPQSDEAVENPERLAEEPQESDENPPT